MTEYKCFRCCYITKFRSSMVKHFNKKNKCEKDIKSLKYSDEEIFRLSFIPLSEIDKPCVKTNIELQTIDPLNIRIKKTKEELLEEMNNIYNNHSKKCTFCHKSFDKIKDLRKHVISECDEIEIINSILSFRKMDVIIVIYGKNTDDVSKVIRRYRQLCDMGFSNVHVYFGGLFEWLLLQEIYGNDDMKTNIVCNRNILDYKPARGL